MKTVKLKDGRDLIIGSAQIEDAAAMIEYLHKVAGESDNLTFGVGEIDITVEKEEAIIEDSLNNPLSLFVVAKVNGRIASMLSFNSGKRPRIRHTGEFGLTVQKDYWNLGIAKEMIKYMLEWAEGTQIIRKINLRVRSDNEKAIKIYKSFGFKEEGIITREFIINGIFYDTIAMGIYIN